MRKMMDPPSNPDHGNKSPAWAALVVDIINTTEVRQILADISGAWLRDWSNGSLLKKGAGRPAAWALNKTVRSCTRGDLFSVFEKPAHIEALTSEMPKLLDSITAILNAAGHAVERLPLERKKALFRQLFSTRHDGRPEGLTATLSRILEEIYADDPRFFSTLLVPLVEGWVANTDFGELKSLLDTARSDLESLVQRVSGLLFQYPAKLIALLALAPDGINLVASLIHGVLMDLNALPPDILTDLFLTLLRQVDATTIGQSVNCINEAIRQVHTGSTLIGEMDAPRFTTDLREKIRTVVSQIDPVLAIKARSALIDGRETLISVLIDTAQEHPDYLNLWLQQLAAKRNSNIRLLKQKLGVFETLPEEDADEALSAGLSSWNAYDLAEMVNSVGRTLNRISRVKPDLFPDLVSEFVNTVDPCELEETLERFSRDLGQVIRPVFRMAAPAIIRELCGFFEPGEEDDGYDEAMADAKRRLRETILGKERP